MTSGCRGFRPICSSLRWSQTANASPLTAAIATRWIEDGTADAILRFVRTEASARQRLAAEVLAPGSYRADPLSFNLWLELPAPWTRSAFAGHMQATGIGVAASDVFAADGGPPEAVRVCLGGPRSRDAVRGALEFMAHALAHPPEVSSTVL